MRFIYLAIYLLAASPCWAADPPADTQFWLLPKVDVDVRSLTPADVKLVAVPDQTQNFALLSPTVSAPSANYLPSNPDLAPFIAQKDSGYSVIPGGLKIGAPAYGDRNYKIDKLDAAFAGLTLLQTKMGHKGIIDGRFSVIVSAAKPCYVFLALDERALKTYQEHGAPSWLQDFAPTGHQLKTDDTTMIAENNAAYLVFLKKAPAGRIVFGPPCMDADYNAMYFAFFADAK